MKKTIRIAAVFLILALASCSDGVPNLGFLAPESAEKTPEGFYDHLANEYTNLAAYEQDYLSAPEKAEHFRAKARRALREQDVAPDTPRESDVPDYSVSELADAREKLVDALANLRGENNDALLAMAQTRYDCWIALREDYPEKDAYISCKDEFYKSLALLNMPADENSVFNIYFDEGSTELDEEAQQTVREIADSYSDKPEWSVVLRGYTDSKGSKSANKVLSMRRAIAVKNLLGQNGINLDNVAIGAEGEVNTEDDTPEDERESRRVEVRVRPNYVAVNKKNLDTLPGWKHSGEF